VDHCKVLCLDEADKLLSQDFQGMLDKLLSFLPQKRQVSKLYKVVANGSELSNVLFNSLRYSYFPQLFLSLWNTL